MCLTAYILNTFNYIHDVLEVLVILFYVFDLSKFGYPNHFILIVRQSRSVEC